MTKVTREENKFPPYVNTILIIITFIAPVINIGLYLFFSQQSNKILISLISIPIGVILYAVAGGFVGGSVGIIVFINLSP